MTGDVEKTQISLRNFSVLPSSNLLSNILLIIPRREGHRSFCRFYVFFNFKQPKRGNLGIESDVTLLRGALRIERLSDSRDEIAGFLCFIKFIDEAKNH